ncbi:MAG: SDR family NAD(P)-dependent oxidoreductase [Chitinophagaceae bacterium]|jgi:NADP-dependent 3-hydroxy acid dehydrogenase YdfG|nr:SDR family NAD(P)-dependent oxidoreductase [Chitinophagaceae bacterium]
MSKIVFITGATAGFGKACAEKFAANGYDLVLNGRRTERLQELAEQLEKKFNVAVLQLAFDVRDEKAVFDSISNLPLEWKNIDVLVNNAGLALGRDYFEEASLEDWNTMIDTNVKGAMYVAKAVSQLMAKRNASEGTTGHIINLGSVAGKEVYEKGNMYCASKFAVDAMTKAMRIDLLRHNIKVTGVHPGAAETEFSLVRFKGDEATARSIYNGLQPLTAEDVADAIYYTTTVPTHVCINDLVITCTQQANAIYFNRNPG